MAEDKDADSSQALPTKQDMAEMIKKKKEMVESEAASIPHYSAPGFAERYDVDKAAA